LSLAVWRFGSSRKGLHCAQQIMAFSQGRWGAEDRSISLTVAKGIARGLGRLPLHIIPDTGHAPYYEEPAGSDAL
jgi:pimeloyl-ACP methyl ester carboxylesterase